LGDELIAVGDEVLLLGAHLDVVDFGGVADLVGMDLIDNLMGLMMMSNFLMSDLLMVMFFMVVRDLFMVMTNDNIWMLNNFLMVVMFLMMMGNFLLVMVLMFFVMMGGFLMKRSNGNMRIDLNMLLMDRDFMVIRNFSMSSHNQVWMCF
jgi:hypothetical protein